jgi:hypothetical protein
MNFVSLYNLNHLSLSSFVILSLIYLFYYYFSNNTNLSLNFDIYRERHKPKHIFKPGLVKHI